MIIAAAFYALATVLCDSSAAGVNGRGLGVNVNPFDEARMAAAFVYSYVIM